MTGHRFGAACLAGVVTLLVSGSSLLAEVNLVPRPYSVTESGGSFQVPENMVVRIDAESDSIYPWIEKLFKHAGVTTSIGYETADMVVSRSGDQGTLGTEGYSLTISASGIELKAPTYAGQFYAVQTLRQLLPHEIERSIGAVSGSVSFPHMSIVDKPRFVYRGTMLDPARRFIEIPVLKKFIDRISLFKMNKLHLHLTDDQGWRLEIKQYPDLTSKASVSSIYGSPGGYYTQDQMKDIVAYAASRCVTIVPEFDMPGHTAAAYFAYNNLAKDPSNIFGSGDWWDHSKPYQGNNTGWSSFNCNSAVVDSFVSRVIAEAATIFPGDIFHVGGDEAQSTDPGDYRRFIERVEKYFIAHGKRMMGWEEIKQANISSSAIPQAWMPSHGTGKVFSWCDNMFIDHANTANGDNGAMNWCGSEVTITSMYSAKINEGWMGVESCCWGEYLESNSVFERRNFPRVCVTAEVGWAKNNTEIANFRSRLAKMGCRLDNLGIAWFTGDNTVSWQCRSANQTASSVFQDFKPQLPTILRQRRVIPMQGNAFERDIQIVDVRGRTVHFRGSNDPAKKHGSLSQGIYFLQKKSLDAKASSSIHLNIDQ